MIPVAETFAAAMPAVTVPWAAAPWRPWSPRRPASRAVNVGIESPSRGSASSAFFPDLVGGDTIPGYPEQAHDQARPIETEGQPGGDEEAGAKSDVQRIFGDRFVGHRRYSAFAFTVFWVIDLQ